MDLYNELKTIKNFNFDDINNYIYLSNISKIDFNKDCQLVANPEEFIYQTIDIECSTCGADMNTIIEDNKDLFFTFYDEKNVFLNNMLKIFHNMLSN